MTFEQWLKEQGFGPGDLKKPQRATLRALYDRSQSKPQQLPPGDIQAPYPNEHAARLRDPGDFDRKTFRRTADGTLYGRIAVPDDVSVIWAKLKKRNRPKDMPLAQSLRFPTPKWTVAKAKKWLKDNGINYERFEAATGKKPKSKKGAQGSAPIPIAASARDFEIISAPDALEITAAEGDAALPTFKLIAYTGCAMDLGGWLYPMVVDLKGLTVSKRARPVLLDHDPREIVGHTDSVEISDRQVTASGLVSGTGEAAKKVVTTSRNGFPWSASIRAHADEIALVEVGKTATANGQEFHGPMYIARKATLREISFTALGADDATEATVAARRARAAAASNGGTNMNFEQWLKEKGFDSEQLTDQQRTNLEAAWKLSETEPEQPGEAGESQEGDDGKNSAGVTFSVKQEGQVKAAAVKGERQRAAKIEAACKGFDDERVAELKATALAGELDLDELQAKLLQHVRDQRPKAPAAGTAPQADRNALLAAAYRVGGLGEQDIIARCGQQALEMADRIRGIGIQEFMAYGARLDGVELPRYRSDKSGWLQAAFSTLSLPGLLSGVANTMLLTGYKYVEDTWRQVCKVASVSNFQQHTRYRLTGDMKFLPVGPDGELKHATLGEQEFTQQADTQGILFSLTRKDIINDDLSAFTDLPRMLGMGAGEAIAEAVWTLLLSNPSSFFSTTHKNYATGAETVLAIDSLTAAELLFLNQVKPNKRPLGVPPKKLLVPPALKVTAQQLMSSLKLTEGGGSSKSKVPTDNPHAGKFDLACSAYLSNTAITGYSSKAWYLFADPNVLAAIEVAFLNGLDRPTVEKAEANFNTLGVQFRGFIDFGVAVQDYRAAAKMKGEA